MSHQPNPITLFSRVEILPNYTIQQAKEYLKRYCIIDTLGDTLYVKKIGNDSTTYKVEFESGEMYKVRKIKGETGNNLDVVIFENNHSDDDTNYDDDDTNYDDDDTNYDDTNYDDTNYDDTNYE